MSGPQGLSAATLAWDDSFAKFYIVKIKPNTAEEQRGLLARVTPSKRKNGPKRGYLPPTVAFCGANVSLTSLSPLDGQSSTISPNTKTGTLWDGSR